jgi:3-oxoacyl-[acyl-carrier protein] reductase
MFRLNGRVAVVTGGAAGLGAATAAALAAAGAQTIVVDIHGGDTDTHVTADVSDPEQVRNAFDQIRHRHGPVAILVNNAGITRAEDISTITSDTWDELMAVNVRSAFLCAQAAMPQMRERGHGRIIQMSSVVAHQGALAGHVHYAASKAALLGLTRTLARTGATHGITVNAIAPGVIHTDLTDVAWNDTDRERLAESIPLGLGRVDDVAHAAVYLASDEARYLTGITLDVNGGMYLR